jgi:hypothetical protein
MVNQDDDGDNSFHIAADASKMIRENLTWVVQMLQHPSPAVDVRNHRQVTSEHAYPSFSPLVVGESVSILLIIVLRNPSIRIHQTLGVWVQYTKRLDIKFIYLVAQVIISIYLRPFGKTV